MVVYICRECDGYKQAREKIAAALPHKAKLVSVGCQDICRGPVVGASIDGSVEWFRRIKSNKAVAHLKTALAANRINDYLEKRRAKKRSGKRR